MRKIESLPEEQIYQVLDYIEFLESRYGSAESEKPSGGFQRLGEGLEDRMRKRSFKPSNLREAFQVIAAADRALSGVANAGRQLFEELTRGSGADDAAAGRRRDAETPAEAGADFSDLSETPDTSGPRDASQSPGASGPPDASDPSETAPRGSPESPER